MAHPIIILMLVKIINPIHSLLFQLNNAQMLPSHNPNRIPQMQDYCSSSINFLVDLLR
jgi:hypothetical protein